MDQWRPIPRALITKVGRRRWTRENPASDLAGFAWSLDLMMDGYPPSIRDLSEYAGWTQWRARTMLEKVREHYRVWDTYNAIPHDSAARIPQHAPAPKPNNTKDLQDRSAQVPHNSTHDSAHHARVSTVQDNYNTKNSMGGNNGSGTHVDRCWHELETVRLDHSRRGRRRKLGDHHYNLRLLLGRYTSEQLVHAWRWWWESDHHIPKFCKDKGLDYGTFLNPSNHARYQAVAELWTPGQTGEPTISSFLDLTDTPPA